MEKFVDWQKQALNKSYGRWKPMVHTKLKVDVLLNFRYKTLTNEMERLTAELSRVPLEFIVDNAGLRHVLNHIASEWDDILTQYRVKYSTCEQEKE
jgi:hypothetical protein